MENIVIKKDSKALFESIIMPIIFIAIGIFLIFKQDYIFSTLGFIGGLMMIIFDRNTIFSSSKRIIIDGNEFIINNAFKTKKVFSLSSIKSIEPTYKKNKGVNTTEIISLKLILKKEEYSIYGIDCNEDTLKSIKEIIK